ncbi:Ser/Thr protein phosphatase, putative [Trichomonas vaginalis G3]|uniref:Serine/threonine-protein phosphatase n=1 Tax=Trichomonas vaginalis (strain ATCC PRA-98 / G3) TaxID=412133 RepID=A2FXV2_TRIV3|nr:phosphoprotein phosphatase protein [Trichomonas vaginalis G3]EAX90256.1 Ser/Thr protein phosphatase, putative [Trichomonas vaginalis G3]KAI5499858.1 phosphoprotein phosphatase protein [Trichomonas vaginalis G3]|eukprot:XP_001303186.1 Ser/Thr protein phosphatase [Trichomonas vaginalis G3]
MSMFLNLLTIGENRVPVDLEKHIPKISLDLANGILDEYLQNNTFHSTVINVAPPVYVVGDLHGDLFDLLRILNRNGIPPISNYLFLGDYIDRGRFPVETILLVISLHNLFPLNFQILRGNHEDPNVCEQYGFHEKLREMFGANSLKLKFYTVFSYLPIAGIIEDKYFCVHGGISRHLTSLSCLTNISLPITEITPLIEDILWSDPSNTNDYYTSNPRGRGHQFGLPATDYFLQRSKMQYIIRAHTYIPNGATLFHSAKVISIFSSSHYVEGGNVATIVYVDGIHVYEKLYPESAMKKVSYSIIHPGIEKKLSATTFLPPLRKPHPQSVVQKSKTVYMI